MISINLAETDADIENARLLFREYESWLGMDLCFQDFEQEVAGLPGRYSPPRGRLYLASFNGRLAGCAALRDLGGGISEMKRLYVRDDARGNGLGQMLVQTLLKAARLIGYKSMCLDTYPPKMGKAVTIYQSHGFAEIPPYYVNPHEGVLFMELVL